MLQLNFSPFPILQTQRLLLRPLLATDAPALSALRSMAEVNRYIDRAPTLSLAEAEERIDRLNGFVADNTGINWCITLKGQPELIGTCCLFNFGLAHSSAELGYELHPVHQGKGIAAEAVEAVINYAKNSMGVKQLQAVILPANQPSVALVKRFGFTPDSAAGALAGLKDFEMYTLQV